MKISNYIGWDIGGAHLKVASINASGRVGLVEQIATPLWQGLDQLEDAFPKSIEKLPDGTLSHALTMTAELVDIFKRRAIFLTKKLNFFRMNSSSRFLD